ncbi:MAG TPA: hypothetical protein VLG11_01260 [Candidatus Saccharimonadales bacterium]|nr:hypothetical protein [Candidatus Saccharimonadales bacterium]
MPAGFEVPSYEALVAEQATVQAEKFQGRRLAAYNNQIFPGQSLREPCGSAVVDLARPIIGGAERATLEGVLEGLSEAKAGQPVSWVDMGGGRALAMRQLGSIPEVRAKLTMTNVDLFNFGLEGLEPEELAHLEGLAPGMTSPETEPILITDDVEKVMLPEPADVITSVEVMQYLNNPLATLANWYNQLADTGLMIVAAEHDWARWVNYEREPGSALQDETPTKHLLEVLKQNDIQFAVTDRSDRQDGDRPDLDPTCFRIMAIQKKPGTRLKVTKPVTEVWVNSYNYKAVFYEAADDSASSPVEIVHSAPKALGAVTLGGRFHF